jgi:hypothetical protein
VTAALARTGTRTACAPRLVLVVAVVVFVIVFVAVAPDVGIDEHRQELAALDQLGIVGSKNFGLWAATCMNSPVPI